MRDSVQKGAVPTAAVIATAFAFFITMVGTTIPTPLYSLYANELHFTELTVTVLFAVYAIGVVATLLIFGRLADDIGIRPVLVTAVAIALIAAVMFLLPRSLPLLFAARIVSGLGAGFMSATGTAAIVALFPKRLGVLASTVAVVANMGGLAGGTFLGGVVADLAREPLVLPYVVVAVLASLALVGLWVFTPRPGAGRRLRVRVQRLTVPRELRGAFVRGVCAAGTGFAISGVITAVSAIFVADYIGLEGHTAAGFVVFIVFAGMALGQIFAQRASQRTAQLIGTVGLIAGAVLLGVALMVVNLWVLVIASVVVGLAGGLCINAGLATTVAVAPEGVRGGVSAAFFAVLYVFLAFPAIGVGLLATVTGLLTAGMIFSACAAVLAAVVAVMVRRARR